MSETNEVFAHDPKLYELGYLLSPMVIETELGNAVLAVKQEVEKLGGAVVEEGEVGMRGLAYPIEKVVEHKHNTFTNAYFGWFKYTLAADKTAELHAAYEKMPTMLRFLVMKAKRTPAPVVIPMRRTGGAPSDIGPTLATPVAVETAPLGPLTESAVADLDKEIESMLAV